MQPRELAAEIRRYVHAAVDQLVARFIPTLRIPAIFAGHRIDAAFAVDLMYVLKFLHAAGLRRLGPREIPDVIRTILLQLDGEHIETFYSYRTAETLAAFGPFAGNPLLGGFTDAQRANIADACDSTHIHHQHGKPLGGRPANYWGVLARCEHARQSIGLPADAAIFDAALDQVRHALSANPLGFFDDSPLAAGRYDTYSPDVMLFLEPLWDRLGAAAMHARVAAHARLLAQIADESGAFVLWGRSVGALSVCLTAEMAATALSLNLAPDPPRMLALTRHAFERFRADWMADGLISAHRDGRMTFAYRGPFRLLQMTLDCLGKWAYTAQSLDLADPALTAAATPTWPRHDSWIPFESARPAGVWAYRDDEWAFQLPVVDGSADWQPFPRSPGMLEVPVDSGMSAGVMRVMIGGIEYQTTSLPVAAEHSPRRLRLTYDTLRGVGKEHADKVVPCCRVIDIRVDASALHIDDTIDGVRIDSAYAMVPESRQPLFVEHASPDAGVEPSIVVVEGMPAMRSYWAPIRRLHQAHLTPRGDRVTLTTTIRRPLRVAHGPSDHDYNRAMYDAMPIGSVEEIGFLNGQCGRDRMHVDALVGPPHRRAKVLHMGWPEHVFGPHGLSDEQFDAQYAALIDAIAASGVKVAWTMHNRRPHGMPADRGIALYRRWAAVTDLALHHSRWGMDVMRQQYAFKPACRHEVVPHGHFGAGMAGVAPRDVLEREMGLPPCRLRIGVLGRWQKEKQIEMLIAAFDAARRDDVQLVLTAYRPDTDTLGNPNIIRLHRNPWMLRPDIARHTRVCDVLLAAHTGDTYLTSGLVADAVAMGITMLVPRWEFFVEVMGDAAIYHDNTPAGITHAIAALTPASVAAACQRSAALADAYDFRRLSPRVAALLTDLARG